jgi:molybdenum cofactor sulfurtransferase
MDALKLAEYDRYIQSIREAEYPMLKGEERYILKCRSQLTGVIDQTYLDHAGTTLYSKSLIDRFSADMMSHLYGNPHSASPSSQLMTETVESTRSQLLDFFQADPEEYDVVFVANATAGVKLVADSFRDHPNGFWYGYHKDCHTSLIGVREIAMQHKCFHSDEEVDRWGVEPDNFSISEIDRPALFAYPAQSNMNGRRLPLQWSTSLREKLSNEEHPVYTLLDAAAFASTSPLDLSGHGVSPDFVVVSLYKIFGFPDLGALLVRKASAHALQPRRYFGGGTVDMVVCMKESWHAKKSDTIHDQLEDGTLPTHSILALRSAMDVHRDLFGSLDTIAKHTSGLGRQLYQGLRSLRHGNSRPVCAIYQDIRSEYGDSKTQGPVVSFNIRNALGGWVSNAEVEKLAAVRGIHLRTGALCNPGGTASYLHLDPWEMRENFSAGLRCGGENDVMSGKPTGTIRVSLGAMSTTADVDTFLAFMREFFVESEPQVTFPLELHTTTAASSPFFVESVTIYPIKSCAGWRVPPETTWEIRDEGLAWDREWCLVHQGTGVALSQKRYPQMALIRPAIDLKEGCLRIRYWGPLKGASTRTEISVPLSADPTCFGHESNPSSARVCGDQVTARIYKSAAIRDFFTDALGVPCRLARFPPTGSSTTSLRHAKAHLQPYQLPINAQMPGAFPGNPGTPRVERPILLSNESPILVVSRSSVNRLNEQIKAAGGKAAQVEVFRANIVVAEDLHSKPGNEEPYAEDTWRYLRIGQQYFKMLGSCRRCQMICINQETGTKDAEPFVTLAKTRRYDGKVFFGQHMCHLPLRTGSTSVAAQQRTISSGDPVRPFLDAQDMPGSLAEDGCL